MQASGEIVRDGQQDAAVGEDIASTVKVVAGAGSGKTRVLVRRYLKFVFEDGISPDRLLALTFTVKAGSEMRARIFESVYDRGDRKTLRELYSAWIMNFHQFAFRIIKENAAAFGVDPAIQVAGRVDLLRVRRTLRRRFEAGAIEGFPKATPDIIPDPGGLHRDFDQWITIIEENRGKLWSPEDVDRRVEPADHEGYKFYVGGLCAVWRAYERELERRNLIDFSGMIQKCVDGLRMNEWIRGYYAGRFEHVLVDEYQDTSEAQDELIKLIAGDDRARVTVVGDEKQSIYRWRDARVENIRDFEGKESPLQTNYRSTQGILDLANRIIVEDPYFAAYADDIALRARRGKSDVPVCLFHPAKEKSFEEEAAALAWWIRALTARDNGIERMPYAYYRSGGPRLAYDEIAVLMRATTASSGLPRYEAELKKACIPYAIVGGVGAVETAALERLKNLLSVLIYPEDVRPLLDLLESDPFALPDAAISGLFGAARGEPDRHGPVDARRLLSSAALAGVDDEEARSRCATLGRLLGDLDEMRGRHDLATFMSGVLETTHFYFQLFADGSDTEIAQSLAGEIRSIVDGLVGRNEANVAALVEALDSAVEKRTLDQGDEPRPQPGRVSIMTIHRAKGLEFKAVAVPGMKSMPFKTDGVHLSRDNGLYLSPSKGGQWNRSTEECRKDIDKRRAEHDQEERCLLYVAITRAEDHLFLSSPFPEGAESKGRTNLFASVLSAVRAGGIPCEELRETADVPAASEATGEAAPLDRRGLDEWGANRVRLAEAREARSVSPWTGRERPLITWAGLHTFGACPLRFEFRHVIGMGDADASGGPQDRDERFPEGEGADRIAGMDPARFGDFVHRFLFEWVRRPAGKQPESPRALLDGLAERLGITGRGAADAVDKASGFAQSYLRSSLAAAGDARYLELPVQFRLDRLTYGGVIDRVDRADGAHRIVDYKTGGVQDEHRYQVLFYSWLFHKVTGERVGQGVVCYLHEREPADVVVVDVSTEELASLETRARGLEKAAALRAYEPAPGEACRGCPYSVLCPHAAGG